MMWVVYNKEDARIYGTFYLKQQAKDFIKYDLPWSGKGTRVAVDKVDMMKYDKWRMWSILGCKEKVIYD